MRAWLLILLLWSNPGTAHEVHHTIATAQAAVISLSYANGEPFAYEAYEIYPAGKETPAQVGRTDARGRIVFVPGEITAWRVKAVSADGHGMDLRLEVPASSSNLVREAPQTGRFSLALLGLSILMGGFGVVQLFLRKRDKS